MVVVSMPDEKTLEKRNGGSPFSLELVAMTAVIAISSWHIGNYMSTFDGWVMAAIMGATLGFCNFLCAHNIFKRGSTSRFPSFVGLIFFAITSTWMQYTYFNENPDIGVTLVYDVNLDALALGIWAPAAEILLGWMYAANTRTHHVIHHAASFPSPLGSLAAALTRRIEHDMDASYPKQPRLPEPEVEKSVVQPVPVLFRTDGQVNGTHTQVNAPSNGGIVPLSKPEAMERLLDIFETNPNATYEQIGAEIGRSKATVANYVRELKEEGRVQISDERGGLVVTND